MSPPIQTCTFAQALSYFSTKRAVVPLLGAGISVRAGIPAGDLMPYLARLVWLFDGFRRSGTNSDLDVVAARGVPTHHELAEELHLFEPLLGDERDGNPKSGLEKLWEKWRSREKLVYLTNRGYELCAARSISKVHDNLLAWKSAKKLSEAEYIDGIKAACDWRALLREAGGGSDATVDRVFDRLLRGRQPAIAHRALAFLVRHWGIRLVLSTNFDRLIEDALRAEHVPALVYEIALGADLPDPSVVQANRSLLKLHGGAYGLRADHTLDHSLPVALQARLEEYVTRDALLVVIGNGGGERRVTDLVRAHAKRAARSHLPEAEPSVLWVYRGRQPTFNITDEESRHFRFLEFPDAGDFLMSVYLQSVGSMPSSTTPYRALPPVGPRGARPGAQNRVDHALDPVQVGSQHVPLDRFPCVHFVTQQKSGYTSSCLTALALRSQRHVIWVSCTQTSSVHNLVAELLREIRQYDSGVSPIVAPASPDLSDGDLDRSVDAVERALRRGAYLLALDSVGEPLKTALAPTTTDSNNPGGRKRVRDFIKKLMDRATKGSIGDSSIAVADTEVALNNLPDAKLGKSCWIDTTKRLGHKSKKSDEYTSFQQHCRDAKGDAITSYLRSKDGITAKHTHSCAFLLALASLFRRTRPVTALRTIGGAFALHNSDVQAVHSLDLGADTFRQALIELKAVDIDTALKELDNANLLVCPQGAFYWMHTGFRDSLYQLVPKLFAIKDSNNGIGLRGRARMHDAIATHYYRHVYLPSRDLHALIEYVFHRVASIVDLADAVEKNEDRDRARLTTELTLRMRYLAVSLVRERSTLLAGRDPFQVADLMDDVRRLVSNAISTLRRSWEDDVESGFPIDLQAECVAVGREAHLMRAEALRDGERYKEAAREYLWVARNTSWEQLLDSAGEADLTEIATLKQLDGERAVAVVEAYACLAAGADSASKEAALEKLLQICNVPKTADVTPIVAKNKASAQVRAICRYLDQQLPHICQLPSDSVPPSLEPNAAVFQNLFRVGQMSARLLCDAEFGKYLGLLHSLRARWLHAQYAKIQKSGEQTDKVVETKGQLLREAQHCIEAAGSSFQSGLADTSSILAVYHILRAEHALINAETEGTPRAQFPFLDSAIDDLRAARETL